MFIPLRKISSWKWEKKRQYILRRDKYLCQHCMRLGHLTTATEVDHITALCNGGTDDDNNLEGICTTCHKEKTKQDRLGGAKIDSDGMPLGKHSWNEG